MSGEALRDGRNGVKKRNARCRRHDNELARNHGLSRNGLPHDRRDLRELSATTIPILDPKTAPILRST